MPTIHDHPLAIMSYPYFGKSSEDRKMKLHCCNEFPNECVVSVSQNNPHSSQKKDFYFSSFLILAAHNAQHQFLISASFCITAERANICKHFAHTFCTPSTEFDSFSQILQQIAMCRKRAYGATIWSQSVRRRQVCSKRIYCKYFCRPLQLLLQYRIDVNCNLSEFCLLHDFKLKNVNLWAISLDQLVAVNSKCICPISLHLGNNVKKIVHFIVRWVRSGNKRQFLKVEQLRNELCARNNVTLSANINCDLQPSSMFQRRRPHRTACLNQLLLLATPWL